MMPESSQFGDESENLDDEHVSEEQQADEMLFEQYLAEEEDLSLPGRGDLREGIVVELRSNELLVNIGAKRDGIVPQSDLNRLESDYVDTLREGETVPVVVSKLTTDEGMLVLSIADALQKKDWLVAEKMLESGEVTVRKVVGYNKGGLLADFDHLRGFIPASHVVGLPRNMNEDQRNERLQQMVGQELPVKVIEVERQRRRLVLSYRLAEREYRAGRKAQLFEELAIGAVVEGEVRSLRPFGAFVDIGGADGLLHVSEIGWTPISHPRDVLRVGERIQVEVLRLDPERSRIALSRKRLLSNPWESIEERYKLNDTILVTITRVIDFGAFAQLEPGIEGLIHISELADITVAEPLKMVTSGDRIPVKILRIHPDRQRIGLSRRQADETLGQALLETEAENFDSRAADEQDDGPTDEAEASAKSAAEAEAPDVAVAVSTNDVVAEAADDAVAEAADDAVAEAADDAVAEAADDAVAEAADDAVAEAADDAAAEAADDAVAEAADDAVAEAADDAVAEAADDAIAESTDAAVAESTDDVVAEAADDAVAESTVAAVAEAADDAVAESTVAAVAEAADDAVAESTVAAVAEAADDAVAESTVAAVAEAADDAAAGEMASTEDPPAEAAPDESNEEN